MSLTSNDQTERVARRAMEDTRLDGLRTLARRRWLVLGWVLVTAASVAAILLDEPLVQLAAIAVGGGAVWLLRRVVRLVADLPDDFLDERQVATRDRVYRRAYSIVTSTVVAVVMVASIAWDAARIPFELAPVHLDALFWAVLLAALGTPSAVYAWTQREV